MVSELHLSRFLDVSTYFQFQSTHVTRRYKFVICDSKQSKMAIDFLIEGTYIIYQAIYNTLQAEDSVDDFFVASRVPLDTDVAKDPITRERVKKLLDKDKIATKWLAIG